METVNLLTEKQAYKYTILERCVNFITVSVVADSEDEARKMALENPRSHLIISEKNMPPEYFTHPAVRVPV